MISPALKDDDDDDDTIKGIEERCHEIQNKFFSCKQHWPYTQESV